MQPSERTLEELINEVLRRGWGYRIEGSHQAPQATIFDGSRHHSKIGRLGQSVTDLMNELFQKVLGIHAQQK